MTELTFAAGARAILDLRDSSGGVAIKDWDGATIKIATEGSRSPFVLKEGDTFRIRLEEGGTISLPIGLPAEVMAPPSVDVRVMRAGGETAVRAAGVAAAAAAAAAAGAGEADSAQGPAGAPGDFTAFADLVSEQGRRIFAEVTRAVRTGGVGVSEDVAKRMEEAAARIDEHARRVAERVQHEVERTMHAAGNADEHRRRAEEHGHRAAERAAERARRHAERAEEHGRRVAERAAASAARAAARAGRGRWWFTEKLDEKLDEWAAGAGGREGKSARATQEERLAVLRMLQEGKISSDQAAKLLDALGG